MVKPFLCGGCCNSLSHLKLKFVLQGTAAWPGLSVTSTRSRPLEYNKSISSESCCHVWMWKKPNYSTMVSLIWEAPVTIKILVRTLQLLNK